MKVVFVVSHLGMFLRHFSRVGLLLSKNGHSIVVLHDPGPKRPKGPDVKVSNEAIVALQEEIEGFKTGPTLVRSDWWWRKPLRLSRELLNYTFYLKPGHPSPGLVRKATSFVPAPARIAVKNPLAPRLLANDSIQRGLHWVENVAPPGPNITRWLARNRPDVVVASPYIYSRSKQTDYVKAAAALGIPTVVPVASWDNLTTKGVFQVMPDLIVVWNRALAQEVVALHDVPQERVRITGAPTFDFMFEMEPSLDRESFCKRVGIDPARPYVVYLGSSTTISGDETPYARQFTDSLEANPRTRDFSVLVRPHPLNGSIWSRFSAENAVVWPQGGRINDTLESRKDYFNTLFHSVAVVGVNTSAFLEAAIVDRPCVAVLTQHYRAVQTELGHFHHLLKGGFLDVAQTFEESTQLLDAIRHGADSKAMGRRRFVREFIKPWGVDREPSGILAEVIEAAAQGASTERWSIKEVQQRPAVEAY